MFDTTYTYYNGFNRTHRSHTPLSQTLIGTRKDHELYTPKWSRLSKLNHRYSCEDNRKSQNAENSLNLIESILERTLPKDLILQTIKGMQYKNILMKYLVSICIVRYTSITSRELCKRFALKFNTLNRLYNKYFGKNIVEFHEKAIEIPDYTKKGVIISRDTVWAKIDTNLKLLGGMNVVRRLALLIIIDRDLKSKGFKASFELPATNQISLRHGLSYSTLHYQVAKIKKRCKRNES